MNTDKMPLPVCSSLSALCAMMDGDESARVPWSAHDLAAILTHLLSTPVERELAAAGWAPPADGTPCFRQRTSWTFAEALARRDVPREMLVRIKDYAKRAMDVGDSLPPDAAKALYAAAITHAKACGHAAVSSLPPASIERLGRWCLAQSWVPSVIRTSVREAVNAP